MPNIKKRLEGKQGKRFERYNLYWEETVDPLIIEFRMIQNGGRWKKQDGTMAGNGMFFHWKRAQEILWPEMKWHRWRELQTKCYLEYRYIGEMGCAAAGKSDTAAGNVLLDWYCWPNCTTVLISSTTLPELELRIFGMIKKYHKLARERKPWIPGNLIESRRMITYDDRSDSEDGRDFRNGILGVACKKGDRYVGLGAYIGIHNKRVRMVGDELHLMPRAFIDSLSNLAKCPDFKMVGLGNPNDTTNAHGFLCEPAAHLGGWESGIDQTPKTKTWETKMPRGVAIQLPGPDSPNMDVPEHEPVPFPFLCTRQHLQDDAKIWGTNDWHYTMFNEARMPRGQGSRRFLTRQEALKFGAMNPPNWANSARTKVLFLDAAYRGVGGDRCIFGEIDFGDEVAPLEVNQNILLDAIASQRSLPSYRRQIMTLVDIIAIPISADRGSDLPEDQIVQFCKEQAEIRGIPPANLFYDAGMRTSLVSAFARLWSAAVNTIDFGGPPTERKVSADIDIMCKDYYSKFVTELWGSVRLVVHNGQFRNMTEDVLWEFCAREWKMVSGNRMEAETKEDMKLKCGKSPDLADGVAIGVEGCRRLGFIIRKDKAPEDEEKNDRWKSQLMQKMAKARAAHSLNYRA